MADGPALTQQGIERFEVVMDTYRRHMADGTITAEEHREFMAEMESYYQFTMYHHDSFREGMATMRRGYNAKSVKRMKREHLTVIEGGKDRQDEPLDAA